MRRKQPLRNDELDEMLGGEAAQIPMLSSGEVTQVVGIKTWRLERFIENYHIDAGQPGRGLGSRRLFSPDDTRRLAIAKWLLDDGFQPKLIAEIVRKYLADSHLVQYGENGEMYPIVHFKRDSESGKRTAEVFWSSDNAPATKDEYYRLICWPLIAEIDRRIKMTLEKRGRKK